MDKLVHLMLIFMISLAGTTLVMRLFRRLARRLGPRGAGLPSSASLFVRNPDARARISGGELVVALPQQIEGLGLNRVAARCWELMDGDRTLDSIAEVIAAEHGVSHHHALPEVRSLASRLRRRFYAMPAEEWDLVHTHFLEMFAGARDEGITELRLSENMIVHAASGLLREDGTPGARPGRRLWPPAFFRRRRMLSAMDRHCRREAPLREAERAFTRGWDASGGGRLDEARRHFEEAVLKAPGWANPHYQLGYVHLRSRRYGLAIDEFRRAEDLSPGFFMVREYLDLARKLEDGRLSFEAFHLFERAAAAEPRDPDGVISLCQRALELSPEFPSARLVLGRALASKKEYERALDELKQAIDAGPDRATLCNALYARGSVFMARGMLDQAVREFEKVIELDGSPAATRSAMERLASSPSVH